MIDFMRVSTRQTKNGLTEVYPTFIIRSPSQHLMIRGGDFYAIWVEEKGLWSTSEQDAVDLIDRELDAYVKENASQLTITQPRPRRKRRPSPKPSSRRRTR
mgnify:CR=1 FL=1